jgi:Ca-activated chloride channel homolog
MTTRQRLNIGGAVVAVGLIAAGLFGPRDWWLTPDQRGRMAFEKGEYSQAAKLFRDPMWRGTAGFRAGEFEAAGNAFAKVPTAEGAYNQANALLMRGLYDDAIGRYDRALELRPGYPDAEANRAIAVARAEMTKTKGGDMTGGQMEADDFKFEKGKSPPDAGEEQVEGGEAMNDESVRALWLRRVATEPADFLRAKFSYQLAASGESGEAVP